MSKSALTLILAVFVAVRSSPAEALVFGGCPEGHFVGFLTGTDEFVAAGKICKALVLDPQGRVKGRWPTCRMLEADELPAFRPQPTTEVKSRLGIDEDSKKHKILTLTAGRRKLITWKSATPIDCVSGIYLSADRRYVAVELFLSRMTLVIGEDPRRVVVFRLRRPIGPW